MVEPGSNGHSGLRRRQVMTIYDATRGRLVAGVFLKLSLVIRGGADLFGAVQ